MNRPCKSCGVALRFARGPNGKAIPLQKIARVYQVHVGPDGEEEARPLEVEGTVYFSHFAACPEASRFSRSAK